jgi:hypothetical protein
MEEFDVASKYFYCTPSRLDINAGDLVICRYSYLPFAKELDYDLNKIGATPINSFRQHNYVADIREWAEDLKDFTPKTWLHTEIADLPEGSFVLKGKTNSKKFLWSTHMYAKTKQDVVQVFCRLLDDSLISTQDIYVREYVPLRKFFTGLHELPITNEFRFFVLDGQILSGGYYWSTHTSEFDKVPSADDVPKEFLMNAISKVADKIRFFAIDVAEKANGGWIVIELNDGTMSGLSENDPDVLYRKLAQSI